MPENPPAGCGPPGRGVVSLRLADAAPEAGLDGKALRLARMLLASRPDPAAAGMDLRRSVSLLGLLRACAVRRNWSARWWYRRVELRRPVCMR